jgi:uncharacterized protein DUF3617
MRTRDLTLLFSFALSTVALAAPQAVNLEPGQYEVTSVLTVMVNGAAQSSPRKVRPETRCLTSTELADPEAVFNERILVKYVPDPACLQRNLKTSPTALSYDEDCDNRRVHVEVTLASTSYEAVRTVMPKAPAPQTAYKISGKRIGDCRK